jgi:primary-amine oxidase
MRDPANSSEADSCHYSFPLPISPVLESNNYNVVRIDILPTGADKTIKPVQPYQAVPANEYLPEYQKLRTGLKPLQVIQPEGASFKLIPVGETGYILDWQKWTFRVGM